MKDHYYIQLTNDSSSLNKINEPIFDAIKLALENNQQHKNVPMFALPTTLSVVPDKFMVYSNISRVLTKEILDTIAKNIYGESFLQTTADEIEVLRSIDTHLILSPGNWIIDIVDEINGIGGRIIPVSFILETSSSTIRLRIFSKMRNCNRPTIMYQVTLDKVI